MGPKKDGRGGFAEKTAPGTAKEFSENGSRKKKRVAAQRTNLALSQREEKGVDLGPSRRKS